MLRLRSPALPYIRRMDLDHADRIFLKACAETPCDELQILTVFEGREVEDGAAMKAHAESMVRRGYLERVSVGGSKSRHQGAAMRATYRPTEAARVALAAVERADVLEAELAALRARKRARVPLAA